MKYDTSIKGLLGQVVHFSSTMMIATMIGMIQGILVLKLVPPSIYGIWASLTLILEYGIYFHLGLINGMERAIPFFRGKGEDKKAHLVAGASKFNILILAGGGAVILALLVLLPGRFWRPEIRLGIFFVGLSALVFLGTQYYMALLKVNQRFKQVGYIQLIIQISMAICLILIWKLGFFGLCIRAVLTAIIGLGFASILASSPHKARFNAPMTAYLFRTGLPIMSVGAVMIVLFSFDRLIILSFLGTTLVGYYGICMALLRMMNLFPMVVGQVFAPVMAHTYGATMSPRSLVKHAVRASALATAMSVAASGCLYFFIPFFVNRFLENYSYGIPSARIVLLTGIMIAISVGPGFLLQTIMRQKEYFLVILATAAGIWAFSIWFLSRGLDLTGVAWSLTAGYFIHAAGLWIYVYVFCRREKKGTFCVEKKIVEADIPFSFPEP